MPEVEPIFPVDDPQAVGDLAGRGVIPSAELARTDRDPNDRSWTNNEKYRKYADEIEQNRNKTWGEMKEGASEDQNRMRFRNEIELQAYYDEIIRAEAEESGDGTKDEETKTTTENKDESKDRRIWVARLSVDGKHKTWLRVDSDRVDPDTDEIGVFEPGKEPRDGDDAGVVVDEPEPTPPNPEPIPPVPPTPEPVPPIPEPAPVEEEGEESALIEKLRVDEAFRRDCARVLGQYSGEGSAGRLDAFVIEFADLAGIDLAPLRGNPQQMWRALQNAYFTEILGGVESKSRKFRISCQRTGAKDEALRKILDDNLRSPYSQLNDEITEAEDVSGIEMRSKAERRLMDWVAGIEITREEDKSDYGVVVKLFKTRYILDRVNLSEDEIQKMDLKTETLKVVQAVEKLHNWTKALESASSFEKLNTTELSGIDEALKTVFEIGGGRMMAGVMEIYIGEMTRAAMADETIGVDIDNGNVRNRVLARMDGRVFKTDEEKVLFATVARDLIRVTGMDAQFFMPRNGIEDKDKPLKLVKGGSFLAGAINFEEKTKNKYAEDKAVLVNGLDFGLVPFLRKIRKESDTRCEDLRAADILNAFRTKFAGTEYSAWINSFDGIVNLQKGEEDFIKSPNIKTFFETVIPLYNKAKKDKDTIKTRIKDVVEFFADTGLATYDDFSVYLTELTTKDGVYNGFGVFDKPGELEEFFDDLLITDVDTSSVVNTASYNIARSKRRERNTAIKNALTTPFRALGRLIRRR